MSKTATAAPAPIEAIELLAAHTHAGRDYPAGATLVLAQVGMDQDSAAWLVSINVARAVSAPAAA